MKKNYNEMASIYLNGEQCKMLKTMIFLYFEHMTPHEKNIACELVHEANEAIDEISEKQTQKKEEPSNEIPV